MKMRFMKALIHELPGADFQSAAGESRRRFHMLGVCPATALLPRSTPHFSRPAEPSLTSANPEWWRFASTWRHKPADNFALVGEDKKFFRCFITGIASALMLCVTGCGSSNGYLFPSNGPHAATLVDDAGDTSKAAALQMQSVTNVLDPALLRAPTNLFTLGPGDKLDIELVDETNSLTTTVVGPDGKIYFSLLPGTDVWGLTLGQTREVLEHEMSRYVRGQPQINLNLRDVQSKHVWLLGRFQQPGVYNMAAPTTLLEAIASAGGSQSFAGQRQISEGGPLGEDLADLDHSFIVRDNKMLPVNFARLLDKGDLTQNIYLQPDDFVYFAPSYAKQVYVLGAVLQPKPVQYVRGMTLMQAIASSYGTVRDAWLGHVTIVRGSLSNPQVAFVNYYDIVKGTVPDVILSPGDIIYVPLTRYRYLRKYVDVALNTFVSTVAINVGSKMTTPSGGGGGNTITIPVGSGVTIIPPPAPPIH
jgi:protein involved in polysaccharide export with SLBB domain